MACTKRKFRGLHDARKAHTRAGFRIRVYRCDECRAFHVTNAEKSARKYGR